MYMQYLKSIFRIWATGTLKEYMTKDFALDDERFKLGRTVIFVCNLEDMLLV